MTIEEFEDRIKTLIDFQAANSTDIDRLAQSGELMIKHLRATEQRLKRVEQTNRIIIDAIISMLELQFPEDDQNKTQFLNLLDRQEDRAA